MKEGWKYVSLGKCCDVLNGLWKGKKEPFVHVGVIRNANFTKEFTLDFSNVEYLDVEERQYAKRKLKKGDLIVEKSGGSEKWPVGRAVLFLKDDGEFSFSNFTSVLRIKDDIDITPEYLFNYLFFVYMRGDTRNMQKATTGIHNIEFDKYLSIQIPLSPLPEQQRIVEYLDSTFAEIDALKAKAAEEVANAKAMFDAALREEMTPKEGWEEKTLPQISENLDNRRKPVTKGKREEGIYPYYGASGIVDYVDGYLYDEDILLISEDGANLLARSTPIAFSVSGKVWVNNHAHVVKFPTLIQQYFVEYYFASINIADYVTGAAQPKLSQKNLNNIPIPVPTLGEQNSIVARLDTLRALVTSLEQKYAKIATECDALKQAILRETFE